MPAAGEEPWAGERSHGSSLMRWIRPLVTVALYALVFWWSDTRTLLGRLRAAELEFVAAGVLLYAAGQALSAYKWYLLLRPVRLAVTYARVLAFYFIGMFFNLFLPTVVGGDAVKALLLSRETGAPARATMSVFMERNLGLLALLSIALLAAWQAPTMIVGGLSLLALTVVLFAGFIAANLVLSTRVTYHLVDRLIAATPLARLRPRAASIYEALAPYRRAPVEVTAAVLLSFVFQSIIIAVVFLNAHALNHEFPLFAVAVFVPLISLAGMLPISVNGLGLREALYVFFFGRLGASTEVAVSMALLYLAVTFLASLPGGLVYALQRGPRRLMTTPPGRGVS
jgi:glycosyltransferase 2 family protein